MGAEPFFTLLDQHDEDHKPCYWFRLHSRGDTVVAMMLPENQSQFSQTMLWQYWLGKASFQINPECFQKVAMEFKS